MRRFAYALMFVGFLVLLIRVATLLLENSVAFVPERFSEKEQIDPARAGILRSQEVNFLSEDGVALNAWYFPGKSDSPLVIYFHGNAGNVGDCLEFVKSMEPLGLSWFVFDYRGYGKSGGSIDEAGMYMDSRAAWRYCVAHYFGARDGGGGRVGSSRKLVLWGFSIGTAAAVRTAQFCDADCLVLEAPLISAAALAKGNPLLQFFHMFSSLSFNNAGNMKEVRRPILLVHGNLDNTVPISHSQALVQLFPQNCRLYTVEGAGHNDLFLVGGGAYLDRVKEFIDRSPSSVKEVRPEP